MDPILAMTATQKGAVLLAVSGIAAPIAGYMFARSAEAWRSIGRGPLAIDPEVSTSHRGPTSPVDPAIQAAEVRQMLEAKAERQRRRGQPPIDVDAEATRLLAPGDAPEAESKMRAELRTEVRQLVVARNERRMHRGLNPLDVEAEVERQLADLVGSG